MRTRPGPDPRLRVYPQTLSRYVQDMRACHALHARNSIQLPNARRFFSEYQHLCNFILRRFDSLNYEQTKRRL